MINDDEQLYKRVERTIFLSPPIAFSKKVACLRVLFEAEEAKELEYWRKRTLPEEKSKMKKKKKNLGDDDDDDDHDDGEEEEEKEEKEEIKMKIEEIEEIEEEYIKLNPNTSIHIVNSLESFEYQCK